MTIAILATALIQEPLNLNGICKKDLYLKPIRRNFFFEQAKEILTLDAQEYNDRLSQAAKDITTIKDQLSKSDDITGLDRPAWVTDDSLISVIQGTITDIDNDCHQKRPGSRAFEPATSQAFDNAIAHLARTATTSPERVSFKVGWYGSSVVSTMGEERFSNNQAAFIGIPTDAKTVGSAPNIIITFDPTTKNVTRVQVQEFFNTENQPTKIVCAIKIPDEFQDANEKAHSLKPFDNAISRIQTGLRNLGLFQSAKTQKKFSTDMLSKKISLNLPAIVEASSNFLRRAARTARLLGLNTEKFEKTLAAADTVTKFANLITSNEKVMQLPVYSDTLDEANQVKLRGQPVKTLTAFVNTDTPLDFVSQVDTAGLVKGKQAMNTYQIVARSKGGRVLADKYLVSFKGKHTTLDEYPVFSDCTPDDNGDIICSPVEYQWGTPKQELCGAALAQKTMQGIDPFDVCDTMVLTENELLAVQCDDIKAIMNLASVQNVTRTCSSGVAESLLLQPGSYAVFSGCEIGLDDQALLLGDNTPEPRIDAYFSAFAEDQKPFDLISRPEVVASISAVVSLSTMACFIFLAWKLKGRTCPKCPKLSKKTTRDEIYGLVRKGNRRPRRAQDQRDRGEAPRLLE